MTILDATTTPAEPPTAELLKTVLRLYQDGLYRQAYHAAQPLGPLAGWRGATARLLAGRLAGVLGNARLCYTLHLLAHREHPDDPDAAYFAARAVYMRQGPWAAWQALQRHPWPGEVPAPRRAEVAALRGYLCAVFRDFQQARVHFAAALRLAPEQPWIYVEQACALALEDRYPEALEAASRCLDLRPWFRPGVECQASLLTGVNRQDEALALLTEATARLECGNLCLQLAHLHETLGDNHRAQAAVERATELFLLPDKQLTQRLDAIRADLCYHLGDEPAAIDFAARFQTGFFATIAVNLRSAQSSDRRAVLDVPYVQQHHLTCAPATLASIARYWRMPAEHVQIAEAICYDGTPAHSERRWAEQEGFIAREFTVDWPTTVALIDRGVPFTFTTVEATTSHLQAVTGYDARRGTLLLRDPSRPAVTELLAGEGLAYYSGFGPRGMVLVPRAEAGRLDGLHLPDAELYDELYLLQQALDAHDRPAARAAYARMVERAADHRLTLLARRTIAYYDADMTACLQSLEQSLQEAPNSPPLLFSKFWLLRTEATRAQRLEFLDGLVNRKDLDPIFRLHLAEELAEDARAHPLARRILLRLLRQRPSEARCYLALADILWSAGEHDAAFELYRVAACLDDRREYPSRRFFNAARHVHRTDEALEWLQFRVAALGAKSGLPAQSLFSAYEMLDRMDEAFAVLDDALRARPDDDSLPLFAVDANARYGRFEIAARLLAEARDHTHEAAWLRAAASLANLRGNLVEALTHWREVTVREPQSAEAAENVTRLLAQLEGHQAALAYWLEVLDRFPYNVALQRAAALWFRNGEPEHAERTLDRLLAHHPIEPWSLRERALLRAARNDFDQALADVELAIALDPANSSGYTTRASIARRQGRLRDAADDWRRALERSVDDEYALASWLDDCRALHQRRAALEFFYAQLVRQTTYGGGLLAYADHARHVLDGETLLANLRAALDVRPDLWHAWSAVIRQLTSLNRVEEAVPLARQAAEKFPLLPGAWADLAHLAHVRGDIEGEIAALDKAHQINPQWTMPIFRLVDAYGRLGQLDKAQAVVDQALPRLPLVAVLHGYRADLLWRQNQREAAFEAVRRAVEIDPGYEWGWSALDQWSSQIEKPEIAAVAARSMTAARPAAPQSWYWLARVLHGPETLDERLAAVRRAIELDPRWVAAHTLHSDILAGAERFDEAAAACAPAPFADSPPIELRVQAAGVLLRRGLIDEAIAALRVLLAENRDYIAGWFQLAAWGADNDRRTVQLEAAQQLVELVPHDVDAWRHLAEAAAPDDRATSKAAWARLLQLEPASRYAAVWLYDLQIADGQREAAEQTLSAIEQRAPDPYVWARRVLYETSAPRPDKQVALAALEKICASDIAEPWPLDSAVEAFAKRRWTRSALTCLERYKDDSRANRFALANWVDLMVQRQAWRSAARALTRRKAASPAWNLAAHRLLADGAHSRARGLPRFVKDNAERLRADATLWGMAGYALDNRGHAKEAAAWLGDYRQRADVAPWMLLNLASALHRLNRRAKAIETHRFALTRPRDHATPLHACWLASLYAADLDFRQAEARLQEAPGDDLPQFYEILRAIAAATLAERVPFNERGHTTISAGVGVDTPPDVRPLPWFNNWRIALRYRRALRPHRRTILKTPLLLRAYVACLKALLRSRGHRGLSVWLPCKFL